MGSKLDYIGCCVDLPGRFVTELVENERDITHKTLITKIPRQDLIDLFPVYGWGKRGELQLRDDWHVRYHKSKYKGKTYYYIKHSGIEYIWS